MTPEQRIDEIYRDPYLVLEDHEKPGYNMMWLFYILALTTGFFMIGVWLLFFPELYLVILVGTVVGIVDYVIEFRSRIAGYKAIERAIEEYQDNPLALAEMVGFVKFARELEEEPETKRFTDAVLQNIILWPLGIKELWKRIQYLRSR